MSYLTDNDLTAINLALGLNTPLMEEILQFSGGVAALIKKLDSLCDHLSKEKRAEYVRAAREMHGGEAWCEVDDDAVVSIDTGADEPEGAYVQGWLWVGKEEVDVPRRESRTGEAVPDAGL